MLDDLGTKNVLKFVRVIVVKTDFALRHVKLKRISALENCGILCGTFWPLRIDKESNKEDLIISSSYLVNDNSYPTQH